MTTISLSDFIALAQSDGWARSQYLDNIESHSHNTPSPDGDLDDEITTVRGAATLTSTRDGVTIEYVEGYAYTESDEDSLTTSAEGIDDVWTVTGVRVVDEDGDEIPAVDLADYLPGAFSTVDYSELDIVTVTNIDVDEDHDMDTYTLPIDNAPSLRFTGELIASASSHPDRAVGSSWSGETGRWTELDLYRTTGGNYVCHRIGRTQWQGERTRYSGRVCATIDEVIEFFGHRWLAHDLYQVARIDATQDVE